VVAAAARYRWRDRAWMADRAGRQAPDAPISFYEVHLGSWRRRPEEDHRVLTYRELADELVPYVAWLGFTHIALTPVTESPADDLWGYRPIALYAPTARFGPAEDFRAFVDRCHQAGIGVVIDWNPSHFPAEPHGLTAFDGDALYEHPDPQQAHHPRWNAKRYHFARNEVGSFLVGSALYWTDRYHVDGLRIGALGSILYLDFDRGPGEWVPNADGGAEDAAGIGFIRRMNETIQASSEGATTVAEDNSGWPMVSRPTDTGGLGFGFSWDTRWAESTLRYMSRRAIHRKYYHHEVTEAPARAVTENVVLPLSHDLVKPGRGSMLSRMSGDLWQKFASLCVYYALMFTQPGKKLMFMGDEFGQAREWNAEISLDWHEAIAPLNEGLQLMVRDLNSLYRDEPALHERDCEAGGFEWIEADDEDQSIISFLRRGREPEAFLAVVCNFTPVIRRDYRVGVPKGGVYEERLNTDAAMYGGGNVGNAGEVHADEIPMHGRPCSVALTVPPFAAVVIKPTD